MPGWTADGTNRWVRDGDDRHLLLHAGTRYVEYHQGFVHAYDGPATPDTANPLSGAVWVRTWEKPGWVEDTAEQIWPVIADDEYTTSTTEPPPPIKTAAP